MTINVALITDADIVFYGLREMLATSDEVTLVHSSRSITEYTSLARQQTPDVAIIDVQLLQFPKTTGVQMLIDEASQAGKVTAFIGITEWVNKSRFDFARRIGVKGYCLKTISAEDLIEAVKTVARGEIYIHSDFSKQYNLGKDFPFSDQLGERQMEILNLMMLGHTNREIAGFLHLSPETVKSHVKTILKRLHARDRTQAVALILQEMIDTISRQNSYLAQHFLDDGSLMMHSENPPDTEMAHPGWVEAHKETVASMHGAHRTRVPTDNID